MTTTVTTRIGVAVTAAALLAGCSATDSTTDRPAEGSASATPTATPTREPVVMSRAEAFTTALAAVPATYDRWTGATSGALEDVEICLGRPAVPDVEDGVLVSTEWADRDDDDPVRRPLEALRTAVVPVPEGRRDAALAAVRDLIACDGKTDDETTFEATSEIVDGVEIATVANRLEQAEPVAYRVQSVAVVDGLLLACGADGRSRSKASTAVQACLTRGTEAVDAIRDGASPDSGSLGSAAVIASRLPATKGTEVTASPYRLGPPCLGEDVEPPSLGVVTTQRAEPMAVVAGTRVLVQPFASAAAARKELANYVAIAGRCTGEIVLYEATDTMPEFRVTRTGGERTDTADGGVRFTSFFGTQEQRQGTAQATEVFALGPHLVFVTNEADDVPAAAKGVDGIIAAVIDGG